VLNRPIPLDSLKVNAIVSAPLIAKYDNEEPVILEALPVMAWWVRGILLVITVCLTAVFAVAWWIRPYDTDGEIRETYPELGLPPCTFKYVTGLPCPSCGMTHSFVFLIHGDVKNSFLSRLSNPVGTLLASFCLAMIPWNLGSVVLRRPLFIRSVEGALAKFIGVLMTVLLLRWFIVMGCLLWEKYH
jgi:hypothetical protein